MDHLNTARPMTLSDMVAEAAQVSQRARDGADGAGQTRTASGEHEAEFSFGDLLDIVNPLQHLPVISTAYRELTGDEISGHAKVIGGTLYGGPLGMIASGLDAALRQESGKDSGEHVVAALFGEDGAETAPDDTGTALADAGASGDAPDAGAVAAASPGTGAGESAEETGAAATQAQGAALPPALTAALAPGGRPLFLDHPGFVAAPATPGTASAGSATATQAATQAPAATAAATTSATSEAATPARDTQRPLPDGVKTGRDALAAFARDMRGVAETIADDRATAGDTRIQAQEARADASATTGSRSNAGPDSQYDFMPLRRQDTNHQTSRGEQMRRLQRLEAESTARPEPAVDPNAARFQTGSDDRGEDIHRPANEALEARSDAFGDGPDSVPPDFAERMKRALDKYRKMNGAE